MVSELGLQTSKSFRFSLGVPYFWIFLSDYPSKFLAGSWLLNFNWLYQLFDISVTLLHLINYNFLNLIFRVWNVSLMKQSDFLISTFALPFCFVFLFRFLFLFLLNLIRTYTHIQIHTHTDTRTIFFIKIYFDSLIIHQNDWYCFESLDSKNFLKEI